MVLLFATEDNQRFWTMCFELAATVSMFLELGELALWGLKLCAFTKIDGYRVISQLWLVLFLALPDSCLISVYLAVISGLQFFKYLFGLIAFCSDKVADWRKQPQATAALALFPLEVCLVCAAALEFLMRATY